MSEKFVVGQWVVISDGRVCKLVSVDDDGGYVLAENTRPNEDPRRWVGRNLMKPFVWQLATYKTTIDGVTATIKERTRFLVVANTSNGSSLSFDPATGELSPMRNEESWPKHLLPYLADEPPPVADAATYSEFEEADECDDVNHPTHYTQHPSGVECVDIAEAFNFNIGNAIKYLWRAGLKGDALEDLRKAAWYVQREIERAKR